MTSVRVYQAIVGGFFMGVSYITGYNNGYSNGIQYGIQYYPKGGAVYTRTLGDQVNDLVRKL